MKKYDKLFKIILLILILIITIQHESFATNAKSIKIKQKDCTVAVGSSLQLSATISPSNTTNKKIKWSSSNKKIATVTSSGKVTGKKIGNTTITARTSNGKKAKCIIRVIIPVKSISLNKNSGILEKGYSERLSVSFNPTNASSKTIEWISSNPKVATVDKNGVVKGLTNGIVKITAKSNNGKTSTCEFKIRDKVTSTLNGHRITLPGSDDRVFFLDVADNVNGDWVGSDAILISSNGKYALIDTGKKNKSARVIKYLRDLGIKNLEFILITHAHEDHIGGCKDILRSGIKVNKLYIKDLSKGKSEYKSRVKEVINLARTKNVKVCDVTTGYYKTETCGDYTFQFYNLKDRVKKSYIDENVNSVVALAQIHGKKIYFSGDIQNIAKERIFAETEAAKAVGKVDFYKVSHHSYLWNNSESALKILNPRFGVVTNHISDKNTKAARNRILKYTLIDSGRLWYTATGTVILTIRPNSTFFVQKLSEDK